MNQPTLHPEPTRSPSVTNRSHRKVSCCTALAIVGLTPWMGLRAQNEPQTDPRTATAEQKVEPAADAFEVLVLGTQHAPGMFMGPHYTPAHIAAALAAAKPDVVAVESHPTWFAAGRFHTSTYEAQGVAVPFARAHGIPVHGVDYKDILAWDRQEERKALSQSRSLRDLLAAGQPVPRPWFANGVPMNGQDTEDWQELNSKERSAEHLKLLDQDAPSFANERDRGIAQNCVELMQTHPGKRLVLVIGTFHKPLQEVLLARAGARVLQMGTDVPWPDAAAVKAAWTTEHLIAILGVNLDSGPDYFTPSPEALARMHKLHALLVARGETPQITEYFGARLSFAAGDLDAADRGFDALLEAEAQGIAYPFPLTSWRTRFSLADSVRFEKARVLRHRGENAAADAMLLHLSKTFEYRLHHLEQTRPRELRHDDAVNDWNFEFGAMGAWPSEGWWTYLTPGQGRLKFLGDSTIKTEGARSLCVEVEKTQPHGFNVHQVFSFPADVDANATNSFEFDVRGEGIEKITVLLDPPYTGMIGKLGEFEFDLTPGTWTRAKLPLPTVTVREFSVAIQWAGTQGAKLWLDNGSRLQFSYVTIPREWYPLAMAREFLRSDYTKSPW